MSAKPTISKPSPAERKAAVEKMAINAPAKVRAGIALIDFREPTAKEREIGEQLAQSRRAKRVA